MKSRMVLICGLLMACGAEPGPSSGTWDGGGETGSDAVAGDGRAVEGDVYEGRVNWVSIASAWNIFSPTEVAPGRFGVSESNVVDLSGVMGVPCTISFADRGRSVRSAGCGGIVLGSVNRRPYDLVCDGGTYERANGMVTANVVCTASQDARAEMLVMLIQGRPAR